NSPEQYALLQFSEPVSSSQDLDGLISLAGLGDLRFTVEGSEVKVYAPDTYDGDYQVKVTEGIRSTAGQRLTASYSGSIYFENKMPSVSIEGRGNILPQSGKLVLPFEAVNLAAVDVTVIKIYERNIPQFLQQNGLESTYELRRVAKPVAQKTIRLDNDRSLDLTRKNRFSLDIDELIKTEPGAIYTITVGFRRAYSLFSCQEAAGAGNEAERPRYMENIDEDDAFWSTYDQYYPYGFNWEERDDPCSDSYYNKQRWASRNVIASNLGLIAKRGDDNAVFVSVTDLLTAEPLQGVELELLDYQQQVLQRATSNAEGIALFEADRKPFLLIARQGGQRAYLKLDDGNSLPLSRFDVGGEQVQKGLKGFIYGERGVWRPGDSIFTAFVLEDKKQSLPERHPVTFEVFNPQGQLYLRRIKDQSENGFYTFPFATAPDAPTGSWTARVKVGGAVFSKSLKIETIMPNRLKIALDFGGRTELRASDSKPVGLAARWLFGGTAQNLRASVDAYLSRRRSTFPKYKGFTFDDPVAAFSSELKNIFDGKLDEKGQGGFDPQIADGNAAPGVLNANFLVKVFEPGGNFSIDQVSMPYHVYDSYVGIKAPPGEGFSGFLLTDKEHPVDIVNLDTKGNPLRGSQKVKVELYKVQWRWWWDENSDDFSNFAQDSYNKLLREEELTLQNGKGQWQLRIDYPEWGRYLLRVKDLESGHITGQAVYIDWPGWDQRMRDENPAEAAMLSFIANKEKFQVGEEVTLTIPSSENGRCLISIESGSRVIKTYWTETQKGQTVFKFKAEKEMAPNVYVNISMLQPHSQTLNDLPIRMYGTIPVLVEAPETILKPVISMPASIEPEEKAAVTVSEASGKPMTYTLAIVDEGLLDLTRFRTPDPHAAFYAREALGVKTWDLFDAVVGAWGGDLERILSIGGDEELDRDASAARANRFKPVVKFMGPFRLEGGKQTHQFRLDPYIGSVRVMVVAGNKGAYGTAEKAVAVKKPLMLLATLPRVLAPGEKVRMPVTVFSTEGKNTEVRLSLGSNELIRATETIRTVHFSEPGEQLVYFEMDVRQLTGTGRVSISASSGSQTAKYEVELEVRNPNPFITNIIEQEVAPGKTWETTFRPAGTSGTSEGYLEISSIPALNLGKRLNYLISYPYGCVEQITSSVFPQLLLEQLSDPGEQEKAAISRNIKAGIHRLRGFQLSSGGLSYWSGSGG
ncbi:MAG TPA: MG2 domain-containing protein, partial [Anseongella sp.]|nr:MG2 domain-containing protein [Anseongella sp.]